MATQLRGFGNKPGCGTRLGRCCPQVCPGVFTSLGMASALVLWVLLILRFVPWPAQLDEVLLTLGKWLKLFKT